MGYRKRNAKTKKHDVSEKDIQAPDAVDEAIRKANAPKTTEPPKTDHPPDPPTPKTKKDTGGPPTDELGDVPRLGRLGRQRLA